MAVMRASLMLFATLIAVSGCGIRRPLIPPKDIPAYEDRVAKKHQKHEDFKREQQALPPQI